MSLPIAVVIVVLLAAPAAAVWAYRGCLHFRGWRERVGCLACSRRQGLEQHRRWMRLARNLRGDQ